MSLFGTHIMLSVVTASLNAALSYLHTENLRKHRDGLGKRLKIRCVTSHMKAGD